MKTRQMAESDSLAATKWDLVLHEYDAVKSELLYAIAAQHTIMTYTLAGTAAIFTGILATWSKVDVRVTVLSLAPLFLLFAWFVWFGELVRMARAARFIWEMEKVINSEISRASVQVPPGKSNSTDLSGIGTLRWESWVRGDNQWHRNLHLGPSYALSSALLIGMAVISMTLSVFFAVTMGQLATGVRFLAIDAAPLSVIIMAYAGYSIRTNPLTRRGKSGSR